MNAWAQLPGEPLGAFRAFLAWLDTANDRGSVERWARRRGMRPEPTAKLALLWSWIDRANEYEASIAVSSIEARVELAHLYTAAQRDAAKAASANLRTMRLLADRRARDAEQATGSVEMSTESIIRSTHRAVQTLTELAPRDLAPRLGGSGEATRDMSRLTEDELELLERLETKMEAPAENDG